MLVMMSPTIEMVPSPRLFAANIVNLKWMFLMTEDLQTNNKASIS